MYVCLVRHGKAEPYTLHKEDAARQLQEKGIKQIQIMAQAARHWWPDGKTFLWSSPYVRAYQTAELLQKALSAESIRTCRSIADGDLQQVYEDILCRDAGGVICIVGHAPALNCWAKEWTGTEVDFKTGSMALFEYDLYGGKLGSAKLLLYMHPEGAAMFQ